MFTGNTEQWKRHWSDPEAVRQRLNPKHQDQDYVVFSDLRNFLDAYKTDQRMTILDYGAGPSPYRSLFPAADYRRADYIHASELDYLVGEDSKVPADSGEFDLVLSTQVAEHVWCPHIYFAECFRLLKPGGCLVLTTHGLWEEHGAPFDFQRWTAPGLQRDLRAAGFENVKIFRLTLGSRANFYLALKWLRHLRMDSNPLARFTAAGIRRAVALFWTVLQKTSDRLWPEDRIAADNTHPGNFYLLVAAQATKPGPSAKDFCAIGRP